MVCATDGAGGWRRCRLVAEGGLEPIETPQRVDRPAPPVTVAFALVKGERPELVVQKLTELGVDRILAFTARRSVVRPDAERAARQLPRLRRVATEACAQSRRLWLPEVDLLADLDAVVASVVAGGAAGGGADSGDGAGSGVVAAEAGGRRPGARDRAVVIGPEGGWAPGEIDGLERVELAEQVLRAETAAITAGALLVALRVRSGGPGRRGDAMMLTVCGHMGRSPHGIATHGDPQLGSHSEWSIGNARCDRPGGLTAMTDGRTP